MKKYRKELVVLLLAAGISMLTGIGELLWPVLTKDYCLERRDVGEGSYEEELLLTVEGVLEDYDYKVDVPERKLTEAEKQQYLEAAEMEIEQQFPGENENVNCIRERVEIGNTYQGGMVKAEWNFDNYEIMDFEGNVIAEKLPEEGTLVLASVELQCQGTGVCHEFYFRVLPKEFSAKEYVLKILEENLTAQQEESGKEEICLPSELDGYQLQWKERKTYLPLKIFLLGIVIALMLPLSERSHEMEVKKKRERELIMEYPNLVSKLSILLSAGMTLQGAWKKIAFSYRKRRGENAVRQLEVYEQMLIACHEMESGVGEERVYEHFGERCGLLGYRKLGNLLSQNLRKGNRGIAALLEREAAEAFEERKQAARRYGEEAGTKLLFPMLVMLGIVMIILMVPAITAFQM